MSKARDLADSADKDIAGTIVLDDITLSNDMSVADEGKVQFGTDNDLQIYHAAGNSYIKDVGQGDLFIQATDQIKFKKADGSEYHAIFADGGSVDLYYAGVEKFKTASSGIDVTGTVVAHKVEIGNGSASGTSEILFSDNVSGRGKILYDHSSNPETMLLQTTGTTAISIDNAQNVSIPNGNLDVDGVTNLDVVDIDGALTQDGGAVFNQAGVDVDFKVVSNNNANMLFVDGGNDRVGIGRVPTISNSKLEVGGADNVSLINVEASGVTGGMGIGASGLQLFHGSSSKLAIASDGSATFTGPVTANAGVVVDNITIDGNTISTTNTNGNLLITPNGTGNVNIQSDSVAIVGTEGESAKLMLQSDEADDNPDIWTFEANTSNVLGIGNQISGNYVDHLTITPNATVRNSVAVFAGTVDVKGGVLTLGTADESSAHINAFELMSFNIDSDNDDTNRHFAWYKNGSTAGGTEMMKLDEDNLLSLSGTTLVENAKLKALAKDISESAVDVFVYDTRKDSDGGAWRKRTQNTSWYNEALNTSTRGARKEFPSVAVIVIQNTKLTIYDGDDPDMPMWIVFDTNAQDMLGGHTSAGGSWLGSVTALNGDIAVGSYSGHAPYLFAVNFVSEKGRMWHYTAGKYCYSGDISTRNDGLGMYVQDSSASIVYLYCRDVAMTVLPNAPIDADTGLPVPTIAVATDGGVSVIKDNGTVVDIVSSTAAGGGYDPEHVSFDQDNRLTLVQAYDSGAPYLNIFEDIPSADLGQALSYADATSYTYLDTGLNFTGGGANFADLAHTKDDVAIGTNTRLSLLNSIPGAPTKSMVAYITSDYNTGYQVGDTKVATLSDTDTTNVTGSELVTNGTFASNITGWTSLRSAVLSHSSGAINVTNASGVVSGMASQAVTLEVGKTYIYQVTRVSGSRPGYSRIGTTPTGGFYIANTLSSGTSSNTFVATSTTAYISLQINGGSDGDNVVFDNVSVRLAERDRSFNNNGLQTFGTVTKTAVATGADLVAYSGFSTSNYLHQPYNADLQFGTGDMSIAFWIKTSHTTNYKDIVARGDVGEGGWNASKVGSWFLQILSGSGNVRKLDFYYRHGSTLGFVRSTTVLPLNTWTQVVVQKIGTVMSYYFDGVFAGSGSITQTLSISSPDSTDKLRVGFQGSGYSFPCTTESLALLRVSATAPSVEQIKKMYNDEKHLFATNAKATLYGTSNAVTALAYDDDTELLHAGTSAGRSVFQGLNRADNTTDAVGAAISASNGLVAED